MAGDRAQIRSGYAGNFCLLVTAQSRMLPWLAREKIG